MEGLQATKLGNMGVADRLAKFATVARSAAGECDAMSATGSKGVGSGRVRSGSARAGRLKSGHARAFALTLALLAATLSASAPLAAQAQSDAVKELAAPPPIPLPLKPSPEFAKFPRYTGTLGKRAIVLRLGPKTDDPSGVHGEYQFSDTGEVILIAGDREGDTLEVEESNDGTHITGNWVGKFGPDGVLQGDRMNVDDSDPQPFDLHPLAAGQPVPAGASQPAAQVQGQGQGQVHGPAQAAAAPSQPAAQPPVGAAAASSSAPAAGAHAVGGVSNLTIGD